MTSGLALAIALGVTTPAAIDGHPAPNIQTAQDHFYNARYSEAASVSKELLAKEPTLELYELRTSILHFQLRRALGEPKDRDKALKQCAECPAYLDDFMREFRTGRAAAREAVRNHPDDPDALFYLGKLDLNYVWLVLDTLGRRTGWGEYREARRSIDAALERRSDHPRARVARAWIEYIVDTKAPWGTAWLLGGGSKKKALAEMHQVVDDTADYYASVEALFGLWDMQVRDRRRDRAVETARRLLTLFPANPELQRFVADAPR
jgi:tetratricopeptide (TPR) repeat protein